MATVILVRHARSEANAAGTLAGRAPGVVLDATGTAQVLALGEWLAEVPLAAVVSSPLERCVATAHGLGTAGRPPALVLDDDVTECDYGEWEGGAIADLRDDPLWEVVQRTPSRAVFPGGESLPQMQARAVQAVRRHDSAIGERHGAHAVWALVSHGDVIKSVLADALGVALDDFQRIHVDPASASVITYTPQRPMVRCVNARPGSWSSLVPPAGPSSGDAVPGGGDVTVADHSDVRGHGA